MSALTLSSQLAESAFEKSVFSHTVSQLPEQDWPALLDGFKDANVFQTVSFSSKKSPRSRVERFVVSKDGVVCAAAAVRVTPMPWPAAGSAYLRWGPLWQRQGAEQDLEVWRQAVRALRAEYGIRRSLWLRLLPMVTDADNPALVSILEEEGFAPVAGGYRQRTMLVDLTPPLDQLRKGLDQKWRNCLNSGERNGLEIVEGNQDELFEKFLVPYQQMVSRKDLSEPGDIRNFRAMQGELPEHQKMRVFLAFSGGEICAGAIASMIGERGIYHFGATGSNGMKTKASYVLQWRIINWLKQRNCLKYDLHGVNRTENPGGYHFKAGLCGRNGKEVMFVGAFDARGGGRARITAAAANVFKQRRALLKKLLSSMRSAVPRMPARPTPGAGPNE